MYSVGEKVLVAIGKPALGEIVEKLTGDIYSVLLDQEPIGPHSIAAHDIYSIPLSKLRIQPRKASFYYIVTVLRHDGDLHLTVKIRSQNGGKIEE